MALSRTLERALEVLRDESFAYNNYRVRVDDSLGKRKPTNRTLLALRKRGLIEIFEYDFDWSEPARKWLTEGRPYFVKVL
jgi:hypothetical protein